MIDTSTPVVVLGAAHHGDLAIVRSLGRLGVPVYIVDADRRAPGLASRYCRGGFVRDVDRAPADETVEWLQGLARRFERPPILLPTRDTAALFLAANGPALRGSFLFPPLSLDIAQSLYNKKEMYFLAKSVSAPVPYTFFPRRKLDVASYASDARFPLILKPIDPRRASGEAARSKAIASTKEELLFHYRNMAEPGEPNVMIQEFIPGGEEANWMFNGYFDARSECLFGLTGKKIRQHPPYAGITSLGICVPNPAVAAAVRRFMKAIGYQGILDIGLRYDARDGLYKVFDANPRIGCTFRLFVSNAGMDVARALYLDLTGQPVVGGVAPAGRKWMLEDADLSSAFRYWRAGKLPLSHYVSSLNGVEEFAYLASDDPRPTIRRMLNNLRAVTRRVRPPRSEAQRQPPVVHSDLAEATERV